MYCKYGCVYTARVYLCVCAHFELLSIHLVWHGVLTCLWCAPGLVPTPRQGQRQGEEGQRERQKEEEERRGRQ